MINICPKGGGNYRSAENDLIEQAFKVSTAVHAYATEINDNTLREKINYAPSDFTKARDTILIDICQLIHDEANTVIGNLSDYGITAAELTLLQGKIDDYEAIVAGPRNAITDRSTATAELEKLFVSGDDILTNKLDKLLNQFKQSDPEFTTQYANSRKVIDMGGSSTGLKGKVTDSSTGDRIANAIVAIPELETDRKSKKDGMYQFKQVRPGTYSLSVSAKGYQTKEIAEVEIEEAMTNELNIELDRVIKGPVKPEPIDLQ